MKQTLAHVRVIIQLFNYSRGIVKGIRNFAQGDAIFAPFSESAANMAILIYMTRCVQLKLFPDEEDALLYSRSDAYQGLDEIGQRVVRAYVMALSDSGVFPTQSKVAALAGLSRHAVANALADKSSAAWQAITEILASCREDLAVRGSIAIPQIAWLILSQFVPGEGRLARDTSTLTKVELEVLKAAAAMGGVAGLDGGPTVTVAASASGDKAGVAVQVSGGEASGLAELVSKLRASQLGRGNGGSLRDAGHPAEAGAEAIEAQAAGDAAAEAVEVGADGGDAIDGGSSAGGTGSV